MIRTRANTIKRITVHPLLGSSGKGLAGAPVGAIARLGFHPGAHPRQPAVHGQHLPGNPAIGRIKQEHDGASDIGRLAQPAERVHGLRESARAFIRRQRLRQWRFGEAGRHRIEAEIVAGIAGRRRQGGHHRSDPGGGDGLVEGVVDLTILVYVLKVVQPMGKGRE